MTKLRAIATAALLALAGTAFAQNTPPAGYIVLESYQPRGGEAVEPAAPAKDAQPAPAPRFEARRGDSLRKTLESWTRQAGWQPLTWALPEETDFTLGAGASFEGDFVTAVRAFVEALGPEAHIRVRFNHANRLVMVESLP